MNNVGTLHSEKRVWQVYVHKSDASIFLSCLCKTAVFWNSIAVTKGYSTAIFYQKVYFISRSGLLCCCCIIMRVKAGWMWCDVGQGFRRLQNQHVGREGGPSFLLFFSLEKGFPFGVGGCSNTCSGLTCLPGTDSPRSSRLWCTAGAVSPRGLPAYFKMPPGQGALWVESICWGEL